MQLPSDVLPGGTHPDDDDIRLIGCTHDTLLFRPPHQPVGQACLALIGTSEETPKGRRPFPAAAKRSPAG